MTKCLLALLFASQAFAADAVTTWTPAHSMKVTAINIVVPSPNGQWAVWTQTNAVIEAEKSEYRTHLHIAKTDGTGRVQLTRGDKSANNPQWSPDSKYVFFTSERAGKPNLYRIAIVGGEAEQLTDWKGTIASFAVSPDGAKFAFTGRDEDKDAEKRKKEKTDVQWIGEEPRNGVLFLSDVDSAKPKPLTDGKTHVMGFDWAPDSKRIAFVTAPSTEIDESRKSDIHEIDIATGAIKPIAETAAAEGGPSYSPDGRYLLYSRRGEKSLSMDGAHLVLLTRDSGATRQLPATAQEQPQVIGWTPDSKHILFSESKSTRTQLGAMPVDGPPVDLMTTPRGVLGSIRLSENGKFTGSSHQSLNEPPEAFVMAWDGLKPGRPVRLSAANTALAKPALGKTDVIRWKAKDGVEIEGLLTYPAGYESGKKYPMVLVIHGGPSGVFSEAFTGAPGLYPVASFAAKGWAVLRPNPRGSSAYGTPFRKMVVEDWGGKDFADIMTGVDAAIALGVADADKLAVMGWSYGGFMTYWTVTQTTRFKAASAGAGITNAVSMYGTQDIPQVFADYFGGRPWEKPDVYAKSSAINFVKNVKTPLLIQHGEQDKRVPLGQAQEFYRALKDLNVPVRMSVYPRTPHGPNEPKFLQHVADQNIEWVEKWLN